MGLDKPRSSKNRHLLYLTEKDADDFSAALREAFPRIRFLAARHDAVYLKRKWNWPSGKPFELPYFESLGDSRQSWFLCWLPPEGWEPDWQLEDRSGTTFGANLDFPPRYLIANPPELQFWFQRSFVSKNGLSRRQIE